MTATRDWMVKGHGEQGNVESLYDFTDAYAGGGGLRSNAEDLLIFIAANTGPPESRLEESMRNAHKTQTSLGTRLRIGLNWMVGEARDEKMIFHSGNSGGFVCFIGFDPNNGVGAVVLINSRNGSAERLGRHLIKPGLFPWR